MRKIKLSSFSIIRLKVILVTMFIHASIFTCLFSIMRITSHVANKECSYAYIDRIIENGGSFAFPRGFTDPERESREFQEFEELKIPEAHLLQRMYPFSYRAIKSYLNEEMRFRNFFSANVKFDGENLTIISTYAKSVDQAVVEKLTRKTFLKVIEGNRTGIASNFLWKCKAIGRTGLYIFVFLDNSLYDEYLAALRQIRTTSLIMGQFFSFLFSFLLSTWAIHMMKKEFDKQKVFLSDAGHELKTPVSVISANVDVLLSSYPGNKWLEYIRTETERMAELTKKLLYLARRIPMRIKFLCAGSISAPL